MKHSEIMKKIRRKINLSQAKFGKYISVPESKINNIEKGRSSIDLDLACTIVSKMPELGLSVPAFYRVMFLKTSLKYHLQKENCQLIKKIIVLTFL